MSTKTISTSRTSGRKMSRLSIISLVFIAMMGGAIGFAAWLSSGTGVTGTVTAGAETPLVVVAGVPATGLTPGTTRASTYTITNPNTYAVTVTSIAVNSIGVTGGTGTGGGACTSANSGVTATAGTGTVSIVIAALGTSTAQTITLGMDSTSATGCQLAVFTPNITASTS